MRDGKMHQTTVRFGPDLWEALEVECARLGVSAAQYLREAALARLAYTAGRRGAPDYELALAQAGVSERTDQPRAVPGPVPFWEVAEQTRLANAAVAAQSQLARVRSQKIRDRSAALRRRRQGG